MQTTRHSSSLAFAAAALFGLAATPTWLGCADEAVSLGKGEGDDALGGGGSGGDGGSGTIPTTPDPNLDQTGCPEAWEPLFEANPPSCDRPSEKPCYWQYTEGWVACSCGCSTPAHWDCYSNVGQPGCPLTEPEQGSACANEAGFTCPYYPGRRCQCDPYTLVWACDADYLVLGEDLSTEYPCYDPYP